MVGYNTFCLLYIVYQIPYDNDIRFQIFVFRRTVTLWTQFCLRRMALMRILTRG